MPTINIEANISVDTLVKAAEQLSTPDLQRFRSQVLAISARRAASSVSQDEAQCLLQINQRLASGLQRQYEELIAQRDAETLTAEQHAFRYEQGSHWRTRNECDCSSTRLKPEAANLAMEPANEAAMPRTVGGETPACDGAARLVEPSLSLSRTIISRASFTPTRPHSICCSVEAVNE